MFEKSGKGQSQWCTVVKRDQSGVQEMPVFGIVHCTGSGKEVPLKPKYGYS